MDIEIFSNIQTYFIPKVEKLECQEYTKAYLISTLSNINKIPDLSNQSLTIAYAEARARQSFIKYQNIGDYLLFIKTYAPEHLNATTQEYYITLAQISYFTCFKMTYRKLSIYEELADRFKYIVEKLKISKF